MTAQYADLEVVRLRPRSGARAELLALRPQLIAEYEQHFSGRFQAVLSETTDGSWVDVWLWTTRADAERALANRELIPSFGRWEELVELDSVSWSTIVG